LRFDVPPAGRITGDAVGLHPGRKPAATSGTAPSSPWAPRPARHDGSAGGHVLASPRPCPGFTATIRNPSSRPAFRHVGLRCVPAKKLAIACPKSRSACCCTICDPAATTHARHVLRSADGLAPPSPAPFCGPLCRTRTAARRPGSTRTGHARNAPAAQLPARRRASAGTWTRAKPIQTYRQKEGTAFPPRPEGRGFPRRVIDEPSPLSGTAVVAASDRGSWRRRVGRGVRLGRYRHHDRFHGPVVGTERPALRDSLGFLCAGHGTGCGLGEPRRDQRQRQYGYRQPGLGRPHDHRDSASRAERRG